MIMKILITGGSGFIGTNLVEFLANKGYVVLNFDINPPRNPEHRKFWTYGNILNQDDIRNVLDSFSPEVIFHLAARTDLNGNSLQEYSVNFIGVENLISALKTYNSLKKIIFTSTRLVCKLGYIPKHDHDYFPDTIYGESKVLGEKVVYSASSNFNYDFLIVRPTSIWGPWFDVPYKDFFISILRNRYFHPDNMEITKSFGFVGNTVHQLWKLMTKDTLTSDVKSFYLADYEPINVYDFARLIAFKSKSNRIKVIPYSVLCFFAKMGDILKKIGWQNPPLTSFRLNNLIRSMIFDMSQLSEFVGELPFNNEQGVEITLKWLSGLQKEN